MSGKSDKIIGIDLGTTNSVVAVIEGGQPRVIANKEGHRLTPSVVAFLDNGETLVGQRARNQAITNPRHTIFSIKRFMGRRHGEVRQEEKLVPYAIKGADDEPVREVHHTEAGPTGPVSQVTVVLDGRTTTSALPRESSILDGAQRSRPDLPFACKGGVCGTCRALVTDGKADMRRNFALEEAEVEAGYVLTCQSYPVSETLTVDFDS